MLLFLVKFSRPDISNAVRELSKVNDGATQRNFKELLRTVRYVLDSRDKALKYELKTSEAEKEDWELKGFCDSDFSGDKDTRKSVTGFALFVKSCLVSWKSKGQSQVTLSVTEAEYVAVSELCKEILFVRQVMEFLKQKVKYPIIIHCDNVGAIFLAHNAKASQRTKHIDVRYHFVREYVEHGIVKIIFVRSAENKSDPFTKNVSKELFDKHHADYME